MPPCSEGNRAAVAVDRALGARASLPRLLNRLVALARLRWGRYGVSFYSVLPRSTCGAVRFRGRRALGSAMRGWAMVAGCSHLRVVRRSRCTAGPEMGRRACGDG
eukprot:3944470-Alexandrium_andersonii.AAC.1